MKILLNGYEIEITARHMDTSKRYNDDDTQAILGDISLGLLYAGEHTESTFAKAHYPRLHDELYKQLQEIRKENRKEKDYERAM